MSEQKHYCHFCNETITSDKPHTIYSKALKKEVYVCDSCTDDLRACFTEVFEDKPYAEKNNDTTALATVDSAQDKIMSIKEIHDFLNQYVIGQDHVTQDVSVAVYNHLFKMLHSEEFNNDTSIPNNILLIGPTGCGKTFIAKVVSKVVSKVLGHDVPFVTATTTDLSSTGYVGKCALDIITTAYNQSGNDIKLTEQSVIFIDELDKIACAGGKGGHGLDVKHEGVQDELLTILGGNDVEIPSGNSTTKETIKISTKNMLFITAGAFAGIVDLLPEDKKPTSSKKLLGFAENIAEEKIVHTEKFYYQYVGTEEFQKYGFKPEFVGRFPCILALYNLDTPELITIMKHSKDSVIDEMKLLFTLHNKSLVIQDESYQFIAEKAIKQKTGARGILKALNSVIFKLEYNALNDDRILECIITPECINNPTEVSPTIIYRENE